MMANHPILGNIVPHLVATLLYLSQIYSYYIMGDISPLILVFKATWSDSNYDN